MDRTFHASRHPRIRRDSPNRNEGFGKSFQLQIASDFRLGNQNPTQSDHEIPAIVEAAAKAGAQWASTLVVRLPLAIAPLFTTWLEHLAPERKEKVLGRIRAMRGGELNEAGFGKRMRGEGVFADQIAQLGRVSCQRAGLARESPELSTAAFRRPGGRQMEMELK